MEKSDLRQRIYARIDELPTLPAVLPKLLALMDSRKSSARDIAEAISRDPALTSKILKAANSAYYGFSQSIATLETAVPLLGFNMVRSLAVSLGVISSLPSGGDSGPFSQQGLWIHSLTAATAMQEMSKRTGKAGEADHLFIVGLLHDIGKVLYSAFFPERYEQVLRETDELGRAGLQTAERRIIGADHGEAGAMLLKRWRFPAVICDTIAAHHTDPGGDVPEGVQAVDVSLLRVADALSLELGMGDGGHPVPPEVPEADLSLLGIGDPELEAVREHLKGAEEGIKAFFGALN